MAYADNLMNTAQNFMTPDYVNKISAALGQPVDKIQSGLKSVISAFIIGLVNKGSSPQGANNIFSVVKRNRITSPTFPQDITEPEYAKRGEVVVHDLFGPKLNSVSANLSRSTGLGAGSIDKLFNLIAPVLLGVVGSRIESEHLSPGGVQKFFSEQKTFIAGFTPRGLSGVMGLGSVPEVHHLNRAVTVDANRKGILWALIAFLILGIFGAAYWMGASRTEENFTSPQADGRIDRPFNSSVLPKSDSDGSGPRVEKRDWLKE